jgi:hypothetical protein
MPDSGLNSTKNPNAWRSLQAGEPMPMIDRGWLLPPFGRGAARLLDAAEQGACDSLWRRQPPLAAGASLVVTGFGRLYASGEMVRFWHHDDAVWCDREAASAIFLEVVADAGSLRQ